MNPLGLYEGEILAVDPAVDPAVDVDAIVEGLHENGGHVSHGQLLLGLRWNASLGMLVSRRIEYSIYRSGRVQVNHPDGIEAVVRGGELLGFRLSTQPML